jgi:ribulose-phosphate 3-epimerase
MKRIIVASSILSADFAQLVSDISMMEKAGVDWIHIDVMDGHFVPNITIGPVVVEALRKITNLFFDIHLMITNPEKYWGNFQKAGANLITFHSEIQYDKRKLIENIKLSGAKVGVSIKPKTSVSEIRDLLPYVDLVLVMTVEPGFSGQSFMSDMIHKIKELRKIIDKNTYNCIIEVDGGINVQTAKICIKAGANVLVSGNYIFASNNPSKAVRSLTP